MLLLKDTFDCAIVILTTYPISLWHDLNKKTRCWIFEHPIWPMCRYAARFEFTC